MSSPDETREALRWKLELGGHRSGLAASWDALAEHEHATRLAALREAAQVLEQAHQRCGASEHGPGLEYAIGRLELHISRIEGVNRASSGCRDAVPTNPTKEHTP